MAAAATTSSSSTKDNQREQDKNEAEKRGVPYKQVRSERRKREADGLQDSEHGREVKRLRAYSHDDDENNSNKRRTRSDDIQEEKQLQILSEKTLTVDEWRKSHSITIRGHGRPEQRTNDFPDPFRTFAETPFNERIQKGFAQAGFTAPTPIQSQAWPIALQGKDMICIAKVCLLCHSVP